MNKDSIIDQLNEVYGNKTPMTIEQLLMRSSKEFLVKYLMFLDQELCKHQKALDKLCNVLSKKDDCSDIDNPDCYLGENYECAECWRMWALKDGWEKE